MIQTNPKSKFKYMKAQDISMYNVLQFEQCGHEQGEYHLVIAETISDADAKEEYYTKTEVDAIKSEYEKTIADMKRDTKKHSKAAAPQPLTFDELRKMDGQPVWVVFTADADGEKLQMWCLAATSLYEFLCLRSGYGGIYELADAGDMAALGIEAIYPYCVKKEF